MRDQLANGFGRLFWTCVVLIALFSVPGFAGPPPQAAKYQRPLTANARYVWGLDAPIATLAAQVHQESAWNTQAHSAYAAGLAQFTPATADWIEDVYPDELAHADPLNPSWALRALVRYDKHLFDRVRMADSECDRMRFALSDYNGGAGWRARRQNASRHPGNYDFTSVINPGIAPASQAENAAYPMRIVRKHQPLYVTWGRGVCT